MIDMKIKTFDELRLPLLLLWVLIIACGALAGVVFAADTQPNTGIVLINNLAAIIAAFAMLITAVGVAWAKINTKIDTVHKAIEATAKAVNGQMDHFKAAVAATGKLEAAVARLEGNKAGYESGQAKAEETANAQAQAVAAVRELPTLEG